ncbi:aldehyde ferredoxin oxidoreductase N-terminal domain-containing protein [Chloroflexota bacterium]
MSEQFGWVGTVLFVDLTTGTITRKPTSDYEPEKYVGGVGLNTRIFWDLGCPNVAAFDPANPLIISGGPLTGLPGPFNRAEICSISPQSYPEELFTYSGFGGKWPSELKYAGYDAVVVVGKAGSPVYISIHDDEVRILDASDYWGLDTIETQQAIISRDPGVSVLSTGPTGDNLARNAVIANETGSTAGQGGFGAVMGSKNLKAIAVGGTGIVPIAKPQEFLKLIEDAKAKGDWMVGGPQVWARGPLDAQGAVRDEMIEKYRKKYAGCYGCQYQCQAFYDMPGVGKGQAMCASWFYADLNQDSRAVWEAALASQKAGINHFDLIGIWFVLQEMVEQEVLTDEEWQAAGLPPVPTMWGGEATDHEFLTALYDGIADGSSPFAAGGGRGFHELIRSLGREEELRTLYETRFPASGQTAHYFGWLGLALHVAMDTRDAGNSTDAYLTFGGRADVAIADPEEGLRVAEVTGKHFGMPTGMKTYAFPPGSEIEAEYDGIERLTQWTLCNHHLKNSLPMCNFACLPDQFFDPPEMDIRILEATLFSLVTGVETSVDELWKAGERIWNLRRAAMVRRRGLTREDDTYPDAIFDTVWEDGDGSEIHGTQFIREEFEALKDRYYALSGWDVKTGRPTRANLEALDMADVAELLEQEGYLGRGGAS